MFKPVKLPLCTLYCTKLIEYIWVPCHFLVAYQHLSKTIEASRVHLFDIMTQYRAIFPDDDPLIIGQGSSPLLGGLFYQWVNEKVRNTVSSG